MINRVIITSVLIISSFLISCSNRIDRIYQNRADILNTFSGVSVITRGEFIHLTFENDSIHDFTFVETDGKYVLKSDTANFELNFPVNGRMTKFSNRPDFEKVVQERFEFFMSKMRKYKITNVSTQFKQFGVALKFYLKDSEVLYIPNIEVVKNQEWQKYLKNANKIDENWYWYKL